MAHVFIAQVPTGVGGKRIFNLEPAKPFGELVELIPSGLNPLKDPDDVAPLIIKQLDKYDFNPQEDCLLLIGNPIVIGVAAALAAEYTDESLNFLQWSNVTKSYTKVSVNLNT